MIKSSYLKTTHLHKQSQPLLHSPANLQTFYLLHIIMQNLGLQNTVTMRKINVNEYNMS